MAELIHRYEVLLFDAYGVLVHSDGAMPGAIELIRTLNRIRKPYYILTNDASKLPETAASRFIGYGLDLQPEKIVTSAMLLQRYFKDNRLRDASCLVLGPPDSRHYVEKAGGRVTDRWDDRYEVLVVCDESGYPFLETLDRVLGSVLGKLDRGDPLHMVLPNPDLIYPKGEGGFGFASGSIALLLESAIRLRHPDRPTQRFVRLGKPHGAIFEEVARSAGTRNMVMIGDQLETDVCGANRFGIDSVLVAGGLMRKDLKFEPGLRCPDFLLPHLT